MIAVRLNPESQQREIQMKMKVYQQRVPGKQENLLMALSDVLLRAIQQWMMSRKVALSSKCSVSLHAVGSLALSMTRCLAVLSKIPVFTFYPWSLRLRLFLRKSIVLFLEIHAIMKGFKR